MQIYDWLKFKPGESFGSVLDRYRGVGPGYDLLRIGLALFIFAMHAKWLSGVTGMDMTHVAQMGHDLGAGSSSRPTRPVAMYQGPLRSVKLALVPMFFALSGFLVMGSAMRIRATSTFLAHRSLRIFPALAVEISLSALVLGAVLTTLPLGAYFAHEGTLRYFGNIVGRISYFLPGVFEGNPRQGFVNMSLWTLPAEFYCYLLMAGAMLTRLVYNRTLYSIVLAAITLGLAFENHRSGMSVPTYGPYHTHVIVYYFLAGVMFYHWKDYIPARLSFFLLSIPLCYVLLKYDALIYAAPFALIYATLFIGLLPLPKIALISSGDYSYGIYLYGFPITQALIAIWPNLFERNPLLLMPVALAVTFAFAVLSWHGIEKHALQLKRRLPPKLFPTTRQNRAFEDKAPGEPSAVAPVAAPAVDVPLAASAESGSVA